MSDELDRAVAVEVMGWTPAVSGGWLNKRNVWYSPLWSPSTEPAAMMEVVEKMVAMGWGADITVYEGAAICGFSHDDIGCKPRVEAATLPEAVALAALEAVRSSK